jgi:hypothetical protein
LFASHFFEKKIFILLLLFRFDFEYGNQVGRNLSEEIDKDIRNIFQTIYHWQGKSSRCQQLTMLKK